MADFSRLEQIFTMMTPADLAGKVKINLGGSKDEFNGAYRVLASVMENDGRGVYSVETLKTKLDDLVKGADPISQGDLKKNFEFHSTKGKPSFVSPDQDKYLGKDGKLASIASIDEIFGKNFQRDKVDFGDIALMASRSPFFHPNKRHTRRVEIFLNSMPSTVLASMVPYLDVEFQVARNPNPQLQTMGQLKFLLGAADKLSMEGANKAMVEGHQTQKDGLEYDFAGMEMFTSPQTLTNPIPNVDVGTSGNRYTEVLDPFRPFASLESATISVTPAVGTYTYKKASLTIKLHDRSRLAEISDLIRPRSYSNVTVWLTYGWRAPRNLNNPYFEYINNNMMMREAYGIINSNFSFDQVGQVTITLELFTKGVVEMRTLKISETVGDGADTFRQIKRLGEEIANYRKQLRLDPPEGVSKEIRVFQVLDSAQVGEFPDMKTTDVLDTIKKLDQSLKTRGGLDADAAKKLIETLNKLYQQDSKDKSRYDLKSRFESQATDTIKKKFDELTSGPDPFLPNTEKTDKGQPTPLAKEIEKYLKAPQTKVTQFNKKVVSFGKLFSVFAATVIISAKVTDELQVFFYSLNEQCGPVSAHSIAEFPIDLATFLDQYKEHVIRRGGEQLTLEEFLQLVINAQVLDNRAIGYGLRSFYEPYDPKNKEAQVVKNKEAEFESQVSGAMNKSGPFKKPAIEMYIETCHERSSEEGESDILYKLAYSAKDATTQFTKDLQAQNLKRIMRIHIYDKQVSPSQAASQLLRSTDGSGFVELPSGDFAKELVKGKLDDLAAWMKAHELETTANEKTGQVKLTKFTSARQVKDAVSRLVPTITFGANGTTIISANLASKNEPLLSTVNMLRTNGLKNAASPNGSGEAGVPLRVIPASLQMTTLGCPLATMAQCYFIDFNTGTSVDNLYIVTGLTHTLAAGKYETQWQFGYADAYGVFEGAPNIVKYLQSITPDIPKKK